MSAALISAHDWPLGESLQSLNLSMDPLTICFWLGIAVLILCIILLISPLRDKIPQVKQSIEAFGFNLQVSILTLLFLISIGLIASGIFLSIRSLKDELSRAEQARAEAQTQANNYRDELERSKKTLADALVTIEGVPDVSKLKFTAMDCSYLTSDDEEKRCLLTKGDLLNRVRVTFDDMNRGTKIKYLVIKDNDTNKQWVCEEEFDPFRRSLSLKQKQ